MSKLYEKFVRWLARDTILSLECKIEALQEMVDFIGKNTYRGFTVTRTYLGEKDVLHNVTEIHFRHGGRDEVAFESDILGTGVNSQLKHLEEFEAKLEE